MVLSKILLQLGLMFRFGVGGGGGKHSILFLTHSPKIQCAVLECDMRSFKRRPSKLSLKF